MVPRRTVCGRRPWSEALAGGGPSIPLPVHPQESSNGRLIYLYIHHELVQIKETLRKPLRTRIARPE